MMRGLPVVAVLLAAGAAVTGGAGLACAQAYPARPIRIVVPFPPGGASDITARILAEQFQASWGTNVVVDNRPGASGIIGVDIVAKANPDGHTLGLTALGYATSPSVHKLPYDTEKDLVPVTITATNPLVLVVGNSLAARTVREFIELVRAKPDGYTYASSGTGSSTQLAAELFKLMTGTRITHIAYKGSTQAHPDLIGGQVNAMFDTVAATVQLIKGGRLRALGVTAKSRAAELPDVPTIAETVPGYEATSWGVLFAPARVPPAILDRIHAEAVRILRLPEVRERLARLGAEPVATGRDDTRAFIRAELDKWSKTVRAAGIKGGQ